MKELDIKELGARIRAIRNRLKLNQTEFGKRFGVTFNTIARWERGEVEISVNSLYKLKQAFNVNLDDLLP
jgi:transcriptional regulator with XRE-family HTH domain